MSLYRLIEILYKQSKFGPGPNHTSVSRLMNTMPQKTGELNKISQRQIFKKPKTFEILSKIWGFKENYEIFLINDALLIVLVSAVKKSQKSRNVFYSQINSPRCQNRRQRHLNCQIRRRMRQHRPARCCFRCCRCCCSDFPNCCCCRRCCCSSRSNCCCSADPCRCLRGVESLNQ